LHGVPLDKLDSFPRCMDPEFSLPCLQLPATAISWIVWIQSANFHLSSFNIHVYSILHRSVTFLPIYPPKPFIHPITLPHVPIPYPSHPAGLKHCNNIWRVVQIIKWHIMRFYPSPCSPLHLESIHWLEHPVLRHPYSILIPHCEIIIKTKIVLLHIYSNLYVFRLRTARENILNWQWQA